MSTHWKLIWIRVTLVWSMAIWGLSLGWFFTTGPQYGLAWWWWISYVGVMTSIAMGGSAALVIERRYATQYLAEQVEQSLKERTR